jgi:uncharacterized protein with GYD domain
MAVFVLLGRYSADAIKEISAERTQKANQLAGNFGGNVKDVYALMGKNDLLIVAQFPGSGAALQYSVALSRMTGISFTTSEAIPASSFDELMGKI